MRDFDFGKYIVGSGLDFCFLNWVAFFFCWTNEKGEVLGVSVTCLNCWGEFS